MRIKLACCFPGLPALWYRGVAHALMFAVLFSWVVCLLLLATFVWPEWGNPWLVRAAWLGVILVWGFSVVRNHWTLASLLGTSDEKSRDAFLQAQQEYLLGNWFEAERILLDLLQRYPRDAEALLLLVSVLKRTGRWKPALRRLEHLEMLDVSSPWQFEIHRERQMIETKLSESV